jgi:hypothetical protein
MRRSVVFPEPFGPVTTSPCPLGTSKERLSKILFGPKRWVRALADKLTSGWFGGATLTLAERQA